MKYDYLSNQIDFFINQFKCYATLYVEKHGLQKCTWRKNKVPPFQQMHNDIQRAVALYIFWIIQNNFKNAKIKIDFLNPTQRNLPWSVWKYLCTTNTSKANRTFNFNWLNIYFFNCSYRSFSQGEKKASLQINTFIRNLKQNRHNNLWSSKVSIFKICGLTVFYCIIKLIMLTIWI